MLTAIGRRIKRIENQIDSAARERWAKDCNCFAFVSLFGGNLAEFEAEMIKMCPVHGFRRLQHPILIVNGGPNDPNYSRIRELIDRYETHYAEYDRRRQMQRDVINNWSI